VKPRATSVAAKLREVLGVRSERERLRCDQIAERFQWASAEAARKWIVRHQVPREYRGRVMLVDPRDVQAEIDRVTAARLKGSR
jgi:transposase